MSATLCWQVRDDGSSPISFEICAHYSLKSCRIITSYVTAAIVENVPIEEKDWWIINSSNLQLDEEKIDSEAAAAASSESEKMTADNGSDAGTKNTDDEITFHNRGYEIWEHCRDAWRSGSKEFDVEDVSSRGTASPRKPMNKKQRERIMLNVTKQREFKLPRKIRLDEMINIYTEVWAVESE